MSLAKSTLLVMTSRVFVMFAGLIVSVVAAHNLSSVEQGYFFTFLSLAAAQTLFELGMTNLILHHLSHARAAILRAGLGPERPSALLLAASTLAHSKRYFRRAAALFAVVVGLGGAAFFAWSRGGPQVHWQPAWGVMVAGSALGLFNLTYYSHLEAFGRLDVSYRVRMMSTAILITIFSLAAWAFGGLLAYPLGLLISNVCAVAVLRRTCAELDQEHGLERGDVRVPLDMGREQRKMAASAAAGYVTANSLTPYAFHFFGAQMAGQVGLTMSIFAAIGSVAMARTTAEAPSYGPLIAAGEWAALRTRFRATLHFSIGLTLLLGLIMLGLREFGLAFNPEYSDRLLDAYGFVIVALLIVANVTLSVTSSVLRAFKTERLMWPSLAASLIVLGAQLGLRLEPVQCIALLAAFNGLVFYPYAQRLLTVQVSLRHA